MLTTQKLLDKYAESAFYKAGELLLRPVEASKLAEEFKDNGIAPLGANLWVFNKQGDLMEIPKLDLSNVRNANIAYDLFTIMYAKLSEDVVCISFVV